MIEARISCYAILKKVVENPYYEVGTEFKQYFRVLSFCASISNMVKSDFLDKDFARSLFEYEIFSFSCLARKVVASYSRVLSEAILKNKQEDADKNIYDKIDNILCDTAELNATLAGSTYSFFTKSDLLFEKNRYAEHFGLSQR